MTNSFFLRFLTSLTAVLILCPASQSLKAQYHPAANQPRTSAIHQDSSVFIDWAAQVSSFQRGFLNIEQPAQGKASHGDSLAALQKADGQVVSLGDHGSVTLKFSTPIADGPGWDFAVFENAFNHSFLELAFVEISSDGNTFARFPASSLTDTMQQKGPWDPLNPEKINNLAGKYMGEYGVPFDIDDLVNTSGIMPGEIRYVRITDVVGSLTDSVASLDTAGRKINDPFPTEFASGGFDLDAVGVIHNQTNVSTKLQEENSIRVFPNPASKKLNLKTGKSINTIQVRNTGGQIVKQINSPNQKEFIRLQGLPNGIYIVLLHTENRVYRKKIIITH